MTTRASKCSPASDIAARRMEKIAAILDFIERRKQTTSIAIEAELNMIRSSINRDLKYMCEVLKLIRKQDVRSQKRSKVQATVWMLNCGDGEDENVHLLVNSWEPLNVVDPYALPREFFKRTNIE